MTIRIKITTGNAAMQTPGDVGRALSELGHKLVTGRAFLQIGDSGNIRDENGNTVGEWKVGK